jgi:uncharacterized membrane protein YfcA
MLIELVSPTMGAVLFSVFFATLTRAVFGFGAALVAMPLLTLVVGVRVASPLMSLIGCLISVVILCKSWRNIDWKGMWQLTLASVVGVPVGLLFLKEAYGSAVKAGLGLLLILFGLYRLFNPKLAAVTGSWPAYVAGFIAGILGGAYNTAGPPIVVYGTLARWSADRFRATLQGYFLLVGLLILAGHSMSGSLTRNVWQFFCFSVPMIGVGTAVGTYLVRIIPQEQFRRYMYVLLLILGIVLVVNSL